MKYTVHVFALVRVKVENVKAESQLEAIEAAEEMLDLDAQFSAVAPISPATEVAFADIVTECLVDEEGDTDKTRSRFYKFDGEANEFVECDFSELTSD